MTDQPPTVVNPQAVGDPSQTPIVRLWPASQPTDLRTLAAEALLAADPQLLDLYDNRRERYLGWADAVLAAVLPAHRAEVLAEAAQAIDNTTFDMLIDSGLATGGWFRPETVTGVLRRLAATGPPTSPASTLPAVRGDVVPEEADGGGGSQGDERGQPTPWDIAHREGRSQMLEAIFDIDYKTAHRLAVEHWRPSYRQPFPPDPYDCGHDLAAFAEVAGARQLTADLMRQVDELRADVERLTRERDAAIQLHRDAVDHTLSTGWDTTADLLELRADRDRLADTVRRYQPVIDAAKALVGAWREEPDVADMGWISDEANALVRAVRVLGDAGQVPALGESGSNVGDDAGQIPPRTRHGERLDGAYHAPAADGAGETEQCPQRFDCPRCRCVLDAGHPGPCDQHCGQPEEVAEHG